MRLSQESPQRTGKVLRGGQVQRRAAPVVGLRSWAKGVACDTPQLLPTSFPGSDITRRRCHRLDLQFCQIGQHVPQRLDLGCRRAEHRGHAGVISHGPGVGHPVRHPVVIESRGGSVERDGRLGWESGALGRVAMGTAMGFEQRAASPHGRPPSQLGMTDAVPQDGRRNQLARKSRALPM